MGSTPTDREAFDEAFSKEFGTGRKAIQALQQQYEADMRRLAWTFFQLGCTQGRGVPDQPPPVLKHVATLRVRRYDEGEPDSMEFVEDNHGTWWMDFCDDTPLYVLHTPGDRPPVRPDSE